MRSLAWLLDSSIRVPFTGFRIGLDAVLGLVPGLGDALGSMASGFILWEAWRLGTPPSTLMRMLGNVVLELVVGAVPLFGDLFDMGFKANLRNVNLALAHHEGGPIGPGRGRRAAFRWVIVMAVVLLALVLLSFAFFIWLVAKLIF